jgi:ferredoxin
MGEDGKSTLKKGTLNKKDRSEELEISSIECAQDAADSCPVQVIHVIK